MDELSLQLTLGKAYDVAALPGDATRDQLFWALDRFDHDRAGLDADARAQRLEASQRCATELDARGVPLRDPRVPIVFPRIFPAS